MATQKQLREERALEKTVLQMESIAGAYIAQDKAEEGHGAICLDNPQILESQNVSSIFGACRFCGQAQSVSGCFTEYEANEYATRRCRCPEAVNYRDKIEAAKRRKEALEEVDKNLEKIFGVGASDCEEICPEAIGLLKEAAPLIYDRKIASQSLKLSYTIQAKISRNSKGNISIERKDATAQKVEV